MRRVVGLASVVLTAALLTGCSAAAPTVTRSATAVELLPVVWHVHDAQGEGGATYLLLTDHEITVIRPGGIVVAAWSAQGDDMITALAGGAASWLLEASRFVRDGDGFALLATDGRRVATLRDDGPAPANPHTLTTPDPVTSATRADLSDATPGPGAAAVTTRGIVGTWGLPGVGRDDEALIFDAHGRLALVHHCGGSGRLDIGEEGPYRLLPSGILLWTSATLVPGVACADPTPGIDRTVFQNFFEMRSVAVSGDHLTLFDKAGKRIGTLTRLG